MALFNCFLKTLVLFISIVLLSVSAMQANPLVVLKANTTMGNSTIGDEIKLKRIVAAEDGEIANFSPNAVPSITAFIPSTASAGNRVTITGLGFTGSTSVSFGGVVSSSYIVVNDSTITAIVPLKAESGNINVINSDGIGSLSGFTYSCTPTIATVTMATCGSYTWHGTTYSSSTNDATFDTINAAGCDSLTTLHLTIKSSANSLTIGGSNNICLLGGSTQLSSNFVGGTWKISTSKNISINNNGIATTTGATNASATVKYFCSTDSASVTFNYLPFITTPYPITGLASVCSGSSIQMQTNVLRDAQNVLNNTTGTWAVQNPLRGSINSSGLLTGGTQGGNPIVQYILTNKLGCSQTLTNIVTLINVPAPSVSGPTSVCTNSSIQLSATPSGVSNTWAIQNPTRGSISNSGLLTGASPNANAIAMYSYVDNNGCSSSIAYYNVYVNLLPAKAVVSGPTSVCTNSSIQLRATQSGASSTWSIINPARGSITNTGLLTGLSANANAIVNYKYSDINGCVSPTTTYIVAVYPQAKSGSVKATACDSYTWNGSSYTSSGVYTYHSFNANGCDSTTTLTLTIKSSSISTTNVSICSGDSYTFNGTTYTEAGTFTAHFTNSEGCDSAATLILTVKPTSSSLTEMSICEGSSHTFNGVSYGVAGTYNTHFTNSVGCDSLAILKLSILQPTSAVLTITSCNSYTWHGTTYSTSGVYTFDSLNVAGCDSLTTLNLTITQPTTASISITSPITYTWHDTTYTESGIYTFDSLNAVGCDSLTTLSLTILKPSTTSISASACSSYNWHGTTYTTSGSYSFDSLNSVGLDSLTILNLTILQPSSETISATACSSYTWHGTVYTESGNYDYHSVNTVGCDSLTILSLTILKPSTATISASSCESYSWHGTTYTVSGNYTFDTINAVGCDSLTTLALTIKQPTTAALNVFACTSYTWHGTTYTTSGTYTFDSLNAVGCDSLTTLNLTIKTSSVPVTIIGNNYNCTVGTTTQLSGSFIGGVWTSSNVKNMPISASGIVSATNTGTTTIKYYCASDSASMLFTVAPVRATIPITGPSSVCSGSSVQLQTNVLSDAQNVLYNTTGLWALQNPARGTIDQNGVLTGGTVGGNPIVQYKLTNKFGCTGTLYYIVTLNAIPARATITGPTAVCANGTVQLTASPAGASNSWSIQNPIRGSIASDGTLSGITPNGNAIVMYKYNDNNGCTSPTAYYNVFVNAPISSTPRITTISGTYCVGSSYNFSATPVGGIWSSNNAIASITSSNAGAAVAKINSIGSIAIVYSSAADSNGCRASSTFVRSVTNCAAPSFVVSDTSSNSSENARIQSGSVSVYPNPARGVVTLSSPSVDAKSSFSIADITGKIVRKQAITDKQTKVNISNLKSGIYFISIQSVEGKTIKKLIINN